LLGLAACSSNEDFQLNNDDTKTISIKLGLSDANIPTRSSDSYSNSLINTPTYQGDALVNKVYFQAYDMDDKPMFDELKSLDMKNGSATATVTLPNTGTYTLVFWSQYDKCEFYDLSDFPNIKLKNIDKLTDNDPSMAAFCYKVSEVHPSLLDQMDITLHRAVAQLNLGMQLATYENYDAAQRPNYSKVTLYDVPTELNLLTSETSSNANLTYTLSSNITNSSHTNLKIKSSTSDQYVDCAWLSMCYMLAPNHQTTISKAVFDLYNVEDGLSGYTQNIVVNNVPITQNYRTNIFASLSDDITFTINTDFQWAGEDLDIVKLDAEAFSELTPAEVLALENMDVIIDLEGKSVCPPLYNVGANNVLNPVRLQCRNLIIKNGTINRQSVQVLCSGNVTISDVKFTGDPEGQMARLIIGPVNGVDDTQIYAKEINIEDVDFTGSDAVLYDVFIAGSVPVEDAANNTLLTAGQGTDKIYINGSKFGANSYDAIRFLGAGDNSVISISNCSFTLPYQGQMFEPAHAINISNVGNNSGVEIDMADCSYTYAQEGKTAFFPGYENHAGFLGLSSYVLYSAYEWGMKNWIIQFHTIKHDGNTIKSLLPGTTDSLLGLPADIAKSTFPADVTINATKNVDIISAYPADYFDFEK
jgi:hypothetical protein